VGVGGKPAGGVEGVGEGREVDGGAEGGVVRGENLGLGKRC